MSDMGTMRRLAAWWCWLVGHSWLWLYGPDREPVAIRCRRCGREERRWDRWFVAELRMRW